MKCALLFMIVVSCVSQELCAQKVGVKTNLAADFALNPNIGLEVGLLWRYSRWASLMRDAPRMTNAEDWQCGSEVVYWLTTALGGSYFGAYLHGGQYNVGGINLHVNFLGTDFRN